MTAEDRPKSLPKAFMEVFMSEVNEAEKRIPVTEIATPGRIRVIKRAVDIVNGYGYFQQGQDGFEAMLRITQFVNELGGCVNPYGFCPHCGSEVVSRERRPNGNDTCKQGHIYPSKASRH